jgi:CxxC motif-containing protein (DUF1111 family)
MAIGRFEWKANQPNLKPQVAAAFAGDLGITSPLFENENCNPQIHCEEIPNGGSPEISDEDLFSLAFYSSTPAVPARRNFDEQDVLKGKALFNEINCASCQVPKIETGFHIIAALSHQIIRP